MIYQNFTNFLKNRTIELIGLTLILFALLLSLSFFSYSPNDPTVVFGAEAKNISNLLGIYGGIVADFLLQSFGLTSFLILITIISWGLHLIIKKKIKEIKYKIFYLVLYIIFSCLFIYSTFNNSFWLIDNGNSGFVGQIIFDKISNFIPLIHHEYSFFIFLTLSIVFFILASGINLKHLLYIPKFSLNSFKKQNNLNDDLEVNNDQSNLFISQESSEKKEQPAFSFDEESAIKKSAIKKENFKNFKLPSLDLLEKNVSKINLLEITKNRPDGSFIEKILLDFGIEGKITKINNGPVVSLYEFEPAPGVKVSKIINLSDDLARNTSSTSARVSTIPGKNTVGIEIPNDSRESVYLKEIVGTEKFQKKDIRLPIAIGKSISGLPIVGDLTAMPHLLIAGTTGSGKSVCINTIIVSLLYRLSPDLCKFILIDPKMLELSAYEGIPHLLSPVITDSKKAASALGWTVREMNNRYKLMSKEGVRNIDGYNAKHSLKMPYIVVVVDEMSDLMLVAGKEIENYIQKLSQMARAAGIHIIMATQRPSVDVITGTIKANFPTRISFRVSSKIDSRTILGEQGAEQLLGNGDMLFMSSANRIARIHGPYVSEKEIEKITNILRAQGEPDYIDEITTNEKNDGPDYLSNDDTDELYEQALNIIKTEGKASTSFLQRKLQIGYNRAARIIDTMEEKGVVSKANHVGKREVL
ncbi:DNA translocase FtsK 4TM domain-containing protein [Pelagibacteraceae bacterium]|nr:DNA translocase FtsK 4TM domain-containing protein [Pelagibacteraceae bacterium]